VFTTAGCYRPTAPSLNAYSCAGFLPVFVHSWVGFTIWDCVILHLAIANRKQDDIHCNAQFLHNSSTFTRFALSLAMPTVAMAVMIDGKDDGPSVEQLVFIKH
jgi:hypothetical protein